MADFEYQLDGELIVVPVYLTGMTGIYDGMFIVDTGASGVIIDHAVAFDIGYSAGMALGFQTFLQLPARKEDIALSSSRLKHWEKNVVPWKCAVTT